MSAKKALPTFLGASTEFELCKKFIGPAKLFAFDIETTGLSFYSDRIIGVSFATDDGSFYIDMYDDRGVPYTDGMAFVASKLSDPTCTAIGCNIKFDLGMCMTSGAIDVRCNAEELMALSQLIDERESHKLKDMAERFLPTTTVKLLRFKDAREHLGGFGFMHDTFCEYGKMDAYLTWELYKVLTKEVKRLGFFDIYSKLTRHLIKPAMEMETTGFYIDEKAVDELELKFKAKRDESEAAIFEIVGRRFNIDSSEQVSELLESRGIDLGSVGAPKTSKISKVTGRHLYSSSADYLEEFREVDELVSKILDYRQADKIVSTYLPKFRPKTGFSFDGIIVGTDNDGRLRGRFNTSGTRTGRWSSSDPNLQNQHRLIRNAFIEEPGYKLIVSDYSQLELRIIGHITQDYTLVSEYNKGAEADLHKRTADLLGCSRRDGKTANFALLYGQGVTKFARASGKSIEEAKEFVDRYKRSYKGVWDYQDKARAYLIQAGDSAIVKTIVGRVRRLGFIEFGRRVRTFVNTKVQGSAGDIINIAIRDIYRIRESDSGLSSLKFLAQVHDELLFRVREDQAEYALSIVKHTMENCVKITVPLLCDPKICDRWSEKG